MTPPTVGKLRLPQEKPPTLSFTTTYGGLDQETKQTGLQGGGIILKPNLKLNIQDATQLKWFKI